MKKIISIVMISMCCFSCKKNNEEQPKPETAIAFNPEKWKVKQDDDYPNRTAMVDDLIAGGSLKILNKAGIIDLLGEPSRTDLNYVFYQISQKRIGSWPLSTKTLVVKFKIDDTVEWVKIHG